MRHLFTLIIIGSLFLVGCEDPVPQDYKPEVVLEAFLIVDEPIRDIRVYWTQSMTDTFSMDRAVIRDAQVVVRQGATVIPLVFTADSVGGRYAASDTSLRILPGTAYTVEARVGDKLVSGSTTTPVRIEWTKDARDTLQYPGRANELKPVDSLKIAWTSTGAAGQEYVLRMTCTDTTGYGIYLTPPTQDTNRRIRDEEFDDDTPLGKTPVRLAFVQGPNVFSWNAFKYYGKHELTVFAGDRNFMNWFKQITFTRQLNPLLGSVTGGLGVVGSASAVHDKIFVKKEP